MGRSYKLRGTTQFDARFYAHPLTAHASCAFALTGEPVAAYGKTRSVRDSETMFNEEIHIPFQQTGLSVMVCSVYSSLHCLCGIELLNLCLIIDLFCRNVNSYFQKIYGDKSIK